MYALARVRTRLHMHPFSSKVKTIKIGLVISRREIIRRKAPAESLVSPVCKYEHNPGVELSQRLGDEVLAGLGKDGADQPEIEGVCRQAEDVGIRTGPVLEHLARARVLAGTLVVIRVPVGVVFHVLSGVHIAVNEE